MMNLVRRAAIEVGLILFLFYANLLMGEYERSGGARLHGLSWAISDVVTPANFVIGLIAGVAGHTLAEHLRHAMRDR